MNFQVKSTVIIIVTLLIGIITGIIISGTLIHRFPGHKPKFDDPEFFIKKFEEMADIQDSQREIVREKMMNHHKMIMDLNMQHISRIRVLLDSIRTDMNTILTPEQQKKLENRIERFRNRRGMKHHPFGGRFGGPGRDSIFPPPPPPDFNK